MLHTATRPAHVGRAPGLSGAVRLGPYEHSRAAVKAVLAAELNAADLARTEATSPSGCAAVVVRAQAALADGNWTLAARLFCVAADATVPGPHGHAEAVVTALEHSARLAASMASPGPSRGERTRQIAALLGASA